MEKVFTFVDLLLIGNPLEGLVPDLGGEGRGEGVQCGKLGFTRVGLYKNRQILSSSRLKTLSNLEMIKKPLSGLPVSSRAVILLSL